VDRNQRECERSMNGRATAEWNIKSLPGDVKARRRESPAA
jgi:hypothetical protein